MTDHSTPRPWHFHELKGDDGLGYIRCDGDTHEIDHHGDTSRSPAENRANAALKIRAVNRDHLWNETLRALEIADMALVHSVPADCWATGPNTGDPIEDLVVCPGCRARNRILEVQTKFDKIAEAS